jgi:hypothetical protein
MIEIGDTIKVYNGDRFGKRLEKANVVDIRYNVKSFCDKYVYPIVYDVYLFDSHVISRGHIPPVFDMNDNPIYEGGS